MNHKNVWLYVLKDLSPAEPASAGDLPPFGLFAAGVYPFLEFRWFHEAYYRVLEAFAAGRVRRLIVTMPPQHGKSVGASTLLPAYLLGRNPDLRIAIASYSASLASKFNRRVQRIIDSPEYAAFFPETTIKRGARPPEYLRTADEVEIIGHRGGLLSVGREGALTGNRVDCFILDDLYKRYYNGDNRAKFIKALFPKSFADTDLSTIKNFKVEPLKTEIPIDEPENGKLDFHYPEDYVRN